MKIEFQIPIQSLPTFLNGEKVSANGVNYCQNHVIISGDISEFDFGNYTKGLGGGSTFLVRKKGSEVKPITEKL